jgi:predicted nucleic acid-binding protein
MNGKEILVDTNILLYLLKGNDTLEKLLQNKVVYVSFMGISKNPVFNGLNPSPFSIPIAIALASR